MHGWFRINLTGAGYAKIFSGREAGGGRVRWSWGFSALDALNYRRRGEAPILEFSCFFRKQLVNVVTARLAVKVGLLAQFMGEPFIPERNVTSYVTVDVRSMKNVLKNLVKDLYAVG